MIVILQTQQQIPRMNKWENLSIILKLLTASFPTCLTKSTKLVFYWKKSSFTFPRF